MATPRPAVSIIPPPQNTILPAMTLIPDYIFARPTVEDSETQLVLNGWCRPRRLEATILQTCSVSTHFPSQGLLIRRLLAFASALGTGPSSWFLCWLSPGPFGEVGCVSAAYTFPMSASNSAFRFCISAWALQKDSEAFQIFSSKISVSMPFRSSRALFPWRTFSTAGIVSVVHQTFEHHAPFSLVLLIFLRCSFHQLSCHLLLPSFIHMSGMAFTFSSCLCKMTGQALGIQANATAS